MITRDSYIEAAAMARHLANECRKEADASWSDPNWRSHMLSEAVRHDDRADWLEARADLLFPIHEEEAA